MVTREVIEDKHDETPDDGTSTDTESYDGDAHGYTDRKEERFIDYYRVPAGRPVTEGKLVRRGIHMTTRDRDAKPIDPWSKRSRTKALVSTGHWEIEIKQS